MSGHSRVLLRGKPLEEVCCKAAIAHDDFRVGEDTYDTCWGLVDPMTEGGEWPACKNCRAHHLNVPIGERELADYAKGVKP